MTWKRPPARAAKQIGGDVAPRSPAPSIGLSEAMAAVPDLIRSPPSARVPNSPHADEAAGRKIRQSAKGEDCDIRIRGACNFNAETTVWSHFPGLAGGRGMGLKSLDLCGVYACSGCHDVVDMRTPAPAGMSRESIMLAWHEGHLRSLVKLRQKGLV